MNNFNISTDFDKDFAIYRDSISEEDKTFLRDEGYDFLHRSNVCLIGYTRTLWRINPYKNYVADAARKDAIEAAMTFEQFKQLVYG